MRRLPPRNGDGAPQGATTNPYPIETASCHTGGITGEVTGRVRHVADIDGWQSLAAWLGAVTS